MKLFKGITFKKFEFNKKTFNIDPVTTNNFDIPESNIKKQKTEDQMVNKNEQKEKKVSTFQSKKADNISESNTLNIPSKVTKKPKLSLYLLKKSSQV